MARIALRPGWAVLVPGLVSLIVGAVITMGVGTLPPVIHDEQSYLLAADTFAHGRLANPTHPMWRHFETFHVIQQPTYVSKYPPGQGMVLALGQVLGGHAQTGALISTAAACSLVAWGLGGWLRPRWQMFAGCLAAVHPLCLQWAQTYWGGAVAMAGGAIVLGSVTRMVWGRKLPSARAAIGYSILLALGLLILANSRPFEGLVYCVPVVVALLARLFRGCAGISIQQAVGRVAMPGAAVLLVGGLWMGYYNHRTTGTWYTLPYVAHDRIYAVAPPVLWLAASAVPEYRHETLRDWFVNVQYHAYSSQKTLAGFLKGIGDKLASLASASLSLWILAIPLAAAATGIRRDRRIAFAALLCVVMVAALLSEMIVWPHYAAPAAAAFFYLVVQGYRILSITRFRTVAIGRWASLVVLIGITCAAVGWTVHWSHIARDGWHARRSQIEGGLLNEGGRHLVIVRYLPGHDLDDEWVYNTADIDAQEIVWARDMGAEANRELLRYFNDRRNWLLTEDGKQVLIDRYPAELR